MKRPKVKSKQLYSNKIERIRLKISFLQAVKTLYWSMEYSQIAKMFKRYSKVDSVLKNGGDFMMIAAIFIPTRDLVSLIRHDIEEDAKYFSNYELIYKKLNEYILL